MDEALISNFYQILQHNLVLSCEYPVLSVRPPSSAIVFSALASLRPQTWGLVGKSWAIDPFSPPLEQHSASLPGLPMKPYFYFSLMVCPPSSKFEVCINHTSPLAQLPLHLCLAQLFFL